MNIGTNLKLLRKRVKRSQEEVAQDLGLTRSSYSGYENGVAQPGIDLLVTLCDYYLIPIDDFLRKDLDSMTEKEWEQLGKLPLNDLKGQKLRVLTTVVNNDEEEMIEMIPMQASAGYASGYADPD